MRKSSCWMVLVALLTITAPTAFADSFSIVFTGGFTTPVDPSLSFTLVTPTSGILDLGTVTDGSPDGSLTFLLPVPLVTTAAPQTDLYTWVIFQVPGGEQLTIFDASIPPPGSAVSAVAPLVFNPNPFSDNGIATVTLNTVAAPEPSPVVLTLVGLGLFVVMRKRKALGLAQAT